MNDEWVAKVFSFYGIRPKSYQEIQKGYRNKIYPVKLAGGRQLAFILYKHEPGIVERIKRLNGVSTFLQECGLPVRYPADKRIIRIAFGGQNLYGGLYVYLPGKTIAWEAYTASRLKELGRIMADMHSHLVGYSNDGLPDVEDEYIVKTEGMKSYFSESGVILALREKLRLKIENSHFTLFERLLFAAKQLPDRQALHMDLVRSNILFTPKGKISGILDFEKIAVGHPLFDIARSLAFLLVDCKYKTAEKIRHSFLESGYAKNIQAGLPRVKYTYRGKPLDLLDSLVDMFLLYDFYKFLRHNPYESLGDNQHYVRTRNRLLQSGILAKY